MFSLFKWQKINFKTSQFNNFAFCRKSMTYDGHNVVKVFFATRPTNPIWVWVQRIPSFFLYYCKKKFYNHFCKAWGFMLQNQGNMPWWKRESGFGDLINEWRFIVFTRPGRYFTADIKCMAGWGRVYNWLLFYNLQPLLSQDGDNSIYISRLQRSRHK